MSLKTKIIGAIVASALACPPAFAVEGSDGMYYTSAAEGFYASIRARFNTGEKKNANSSVVGDAGSRFGLQGTGEMSHGLEAFYRYELRVPDSGDNVRTGISFVGLRGGFGEVRFGQWDLVEHDWVSARTDFANNGNRPDTFNLKSDQAIQYKSPDFNGLQVGAAFRFPGGDEVDSTMGGTSVTLTTPGDPGDIDHPVNDLESWALAGNYSFSGFNVGASYATRADGIHKINGGTLVEAADEGMDIPGTGDLTYGEDDIGKPKTLMFEGFEDYTTWGVSGSYAQDNWTVATFYKQDNMSDKGMTPDDVKHEDQTYFSVAGRVNIGKTGVIVTHDTRENSDGKEDVATTFEVEYHLNSKAKVWVGYTSSDYDTDSDVDDDVYFGLRHDF